MDETYQCKCSKCGYEFAWSVYDGKPSCGRCAKAAFEAEMDENLCSSCSLNPAEREGMCSECLALEARENRSGYEKPADLSGFQQRYAQEAEKSHRTWAETAWWQN